MEVASVAVDFHPVDPLGQGIVGEGPEVLPAGREAVQLRDQPLAVKGSLLGALRIVNTYSQRHVALHPGA